MTNAQLLFSIALAIISSIIVLFAGYVLSSTLWTNRWIRKPAQPQAQGPADPEADQ